MNNGDWEMEKLTAHEKMLLKVKALEERKIRREKLKERESKAYAAHNYHRKYNRTKSSNNRRVNRYKF